MVETHGPATPPSRRGRSPRPRRATPFDGRIIAVFNTHSGSCDASSEGEARQIFVRAGLRSVEFVAVASGEVAAALADAVDRADVLVVLGGDGTIAAAATLCGATGPYLIPLPGGTMNMLPKALYGSADWRSVLKATLQRPIVRNVSGGEAGGRRFYCAAIFGSPSLWADAREAVRDGNLVEAAKRALTATQRSLADSVEYAFGDLQGSAEAVAVICPLISKVMEGEEAALEAAALEPSTAADLFGLAYHAAFDDWRNDPSITRAKVSCADVRAHGEIPAILDGEKVRIEREVRITFIPTAFRALAPLNRSRQKNSEQRLTNDSAKAGDIARISTAGTPPPNLSSILGAGELVALAPTRRDTLLAPPPTPIASAADTAPAARRLAPTGSA